MSNSKPQQSAEAKELERARVAAGLSQRALARDLGITQGHYSKVVDGLVGDKKAYIKRGLRLLAAPAEPTESIDRLIQVAVRELRTSASFRRLVDAALGYSWRDET